MDAKPALISIVVCSNDPRKFAAISKNLADRLGDASFEVIGIHDARFLAEGYNRGVDQSAGDIVILCYDDIEIVTPDFARVVRRHLDTHDVIGCAGTDCLINSNWIWAGDPFVHGIVAYPADDAWPAQHFDLTVWGGFERAIVDDIQALDGLFLAANRRALESIRFDEANFDGFHVYDIDFTSAAHLAGFRIAVCKDMLIAHRSRGNFGREYAAFGAGFMKKYAGRLRVQAHNSRNTAVARDLDRAQMLNLCDSVIGTGAT